MTRCHRCGRQWVSEKKQPAIKECCEGCNAYLHCCLNCRFYAPYKHNKCLIPTTDWVGDRAGCNFCDEFEFADTELGAKGAAKKDQARDAFQDLFGGEDSDGPKEGKDAFNQLFGE